MLDELADLYDEIRSEPPYNSAGPIWTRNAFLDRTRHQLDHPSFSLVTAHADQSMVGFAFGLPFTAGTWFSGDTPPPEEVKAAPKFAVIELDVRRAYRGRGIGRALLDALLDGRPEPYAMLATLTAAPAHRMYLRWGWRHAASSVPGGNIPPMETLILPLTVPN